VSFAPTSQTFVLNEKLVSIGGDLWIEDGNGNHAFEVDGKAFSLRRSLILRDTSGNDLYEINKSLAHVHTTFEIKRGDQVVATIQKALMSLFGEHFTITAANGDKLNVTGDWIAREFHIQENDADVILVSRRFLTIHGSYGVQIAAGFDVPLGIAVVIALEQIEAEEGRR
jgi:uncharacterized protein YxjI